VAQAAETSSHPATASQEGHSLSHNTSHSIESSGAPEPAQASDAGWSEAERIVARCAFDRAQQRAIRSLVETVQVHAGGLDSVESVWVLHDYLSSQRHAIEGRFDFRLEGLLIVFAGLVRDELLSLDELQGLEATKLAKIAALSKF
jgi:hypothetical protein